MVYIFQDMLVSLSTLLHGTLHAKLMWTFRVYDLNGDGVITKNEMGNVVVAVYELMGIILKPPVSKQLLRILYNSQNTLLSFDYNQGMVLKLNTPPRPNISMLT